MYGSAVNESSAVLRYLLMVLIEKKLQYWILYRVQQIKWGHLKAHALGTNYDEVDLVFPGWSWVFTTRTKFKPGEEETLRLPCGRGLRHFQVLSCPWRRHREPRRFVLLAATSSCWPYKGFAGDPNHLRVGCAKLQAAGAMLNSKAP